MGHEHRSPFVLAKDSDVYVSKAGSMVNWLVLAFVKEVSESY